MGTRIKVLFYATDRTGERSLRKGGCKLTFTTLEDYKRIMSPVLYERIVYDLNKYGVYNSRSHRIKLI